MSLCVYKTGVQRFSLKKLQVSVGRRKEVGDGLTYLKYLKYFKVFKVSYVDTYVKSLK